MRGHRRDILVLAYASSLAGSSLWLLLAGPLTLPVGLAASALLIAAALPFLCLAERDRGLRALRLARSLERVARDLTAETDPLAVLRSIPESALAVVPAEYAALVVRHGDRFEIAAGAGLATRVIGMRRGTDEGVFSDRSATAAAR
jgi:hypothetical protein